MKLVQLLFGVMLCLSLLVIGCTASEKEGVTVSVPIEEQKGIEQVQSPTPVQTLPFSEPEVSSVSVSTPKKSVEPAIKSESAEAIQLPSEGAVKTFSIIARQWEFEPSTITVSKGDRVHLTITSKDVTHGFNIPEYNINEKINPGKTTQVEFVADKAGTFDFFCSVPCGKGHAGMNGQLIVQE